MNGPVGYVTGKYNERAFQGLDHVIDSAGRNGVKVLLTLADNWPSNLSISGTADSKQTVMYRPFPSLLCRCLKLCF